MDLIKIGKFITEERKRKNCAFAVCYRRGSRPFDGTDWNQDLTPAPPRMRGASSDLYEFRMGA